MSDTVASALEVVLVVALTAGLAMAVLMWRIYRMQNPPELRWPKRSRRRRSSSSSRLRD